MKRRRSFNRDEQIATLKDFLRRKRWTQVALIKWLDENGVTITAQYLNDVLNGRRNPGPRFIGIFKEITGLTLCEGLIEDEGKRK